ncbi:MAG: alginate export family protein [Anaerohalosphaeraceae bacterium]|nr:alginate export family protein [Anaerohalosphaeraceae bacterium]
MKKGVYIEIIAILVVVGLFATASFAAEETGKDVQPRVEQTISPASTAVHDHSRNFGDWFHNPASWLEMGADVRFRWVYGWNLDTINDDARGRSSKWHFLRNRFRWWTKTKVTEDVSFNHRWTWEFRSWDDPYRKGKEVDWDEIVWDHFNLKVKNFGGMPVTMVAGRQDIILGKGWLVLDGSPLDGSRTISMDALRFTYDMEDRDTTVDLIYVQNYAASNKWLKPIGSNDRHITEQDETGAIIYITDKSRENMQLEGYFIYKNDNPINQPANDFPNPWPSAVWSKKSEIYTFGGAISGSFGQNKNWKYRNELAVQTGDKQKQDLHAWGTRNDIEYHFNNEKKHVLHGTLEYLSGDDPETKTDEAFDPLWGEWPQWSDLYVYCYNLETMIGETTNLFRLGGGHSFYPTEKVQMCTDYHLLWADENTKKDAPHRSGLTWSDSGKFRGQLATWMLKYQITKQLKGHLLLEMFLPGNYYEDSSRDHVFFSRFNLEYTF